MMRFVLASLVVSTSALAQVGVPAPPTDCAGFTGITNGSQPPQVPAPGGGDVIGSGFIQVVSPPSNLTDVPRNVQIVLSGDIPSLDADPPLFSVELRDLDANRLAIVRAGAFVRPAATLAARQTFLVHIEPTAANPCPDCSGVQELAFTTGDDVDTEPPVLDGAPPVNVFVLPSPEEAARCGMFFSQTHQLVIDFGPAFPINTWITVTARKEGGEVKNLTELFNTTQAFPFTTDLGTSLPVALGDSFIVAVTPRDLAGNVGPARVVRVRARSFIDENKPRDELAPLWCELPSTPVVDAPTTIPANGRIEVDFPFEEIPVALALDDGTQTPLVPIVDTEHGHLYDTAEPLPAGAQFHVVGLACPHCVCKGCLVTPGASIGALDPVADVVDTTPPAAPEVLELGEDAAPALAVAGPCHADRPALTVVLAPGTDDVSSAADLRYDAVIQIKDGPPLALGTSLVPLVRADGNTVLRIETRGLGRVLASRFVLTLAAVDAAGNHAESTTQHGEASSGGCASTSSRDVSVLALLAGLAAWRRRRNA